MSDRTAYNPGFLGRPQVPDPLQEEIVRGGYQQPLAHPESVSVPPTEWEVAGDDIDRASRIARRENARIRQGAVQSPYYDTLHDRLQTTQAWRYVVDTEFNGPISVPAAGAFADTPVLRTQPILPGYPGDKLVYPYINYMGLAMAVTTFTGFWTLEFVCEQYKVPLLIGSGNTVQVFNTSPDVLVPVPIQGGKDDTTPIGNIRLSIAGGATVTGVTMQGLMALGYAYRYISRPGHQETGRP